jgi:PEGA domain
MKQLAAGLIVAVLTCVATAKDKEHEWKDGLLIDATSESRSYTYSTPVTGQVSDSGQVNLYGGTQSGRVEIWTYAIDDGTFVWVATRDLRLRWDKPFKTTVNKPLKFAVEKSDVYVLDEDGKEHKLELKKKIAKTDFKMQGNAAAPPAESGTVRVTSSPDAAEIAVDGSFMGNAPSTIKLAPGKHEIRLSAKGYRDASRTLQMTSGSELNLQLVLEKEQ